MVSLMVHLTGGSMWDLFKRAVPPMPEWASKQSEQVAKSETITLEKAQATPAPAVVAPPKPAAPPPPITAEHPRPIPVPAPVTNHHEIAHITIHAPKQNAPSRGEGSAEIPHETRPAGGPKGPKHLAYSDAQLAALNGQFSQTIADTKQTLAQANAAMQTAPVTTMKHFQMTYSGIHEGMNPGDGIIEPIGVPQHKNGYVYYYTHYEYMYGDGHTEEDDIPWPFIYPERDDPFARHDKRVPLQPPPAGYVRTRELKPILMQFFGGPPPE